MTQIMNKRLIPNQTTFLIVTINKNNGDGLRRTITSVAKQSYANYLFAVIDGCSSDHSIEVARLSPCIDYFISEKDSGIYEAMNKGTSPLLFLCNYVVYMNSGDEFYSSATLQMV